MAAKKKLKVVFQKGAFDHIPEDQREEAQQQVLKAFEEFDPQDVEPVDPLPEGAQACPECGGKLSAGPVIELPEDDGVVQVFDCNECGRSFLGKPLN
jgi:hypothetical protein